MPRRGSGYPYEDDGRCHWCDTRYAGRGHICTECREALDKPSPEVFYKDSIPPFYSGAKATDFKRPQPVKASTEDLTALTEREADERLKQLGIGSVVQGKISKAEYELVSFDAFGNPEFKEKGDPRSYTQTLGSNHLLILSAVSPQLKSGSNTFSYPPLGSEWIRKAGKPTGNCKSVEITAHGKDLTGSLDPTRVQYRRSSDNGIDSMHINDFYRIYEATSSYPPIGSKWIGQSGQRRKRGVIEITGHGISMQGSPSPDSVQYKYESGINAGGSRKTGGLDSMSVGIFYTEWEGVPGSVPESQTSKLETNDGRDTCRHCGAPTMHIGCMRGSDMKICTVCKR